MLPGGLGSLSKGENLLRALQFSHKVTIVFASQPRVMTSGEGRGEGRDYCSRWDLEATAKLVNALNAPRIGAMRPEVHISHARQQDGAGYWAKEIADTRLGSVVVLGSELMNVAAGAMLGSLFPGETRAPFQVIWPSAQVPKGFLPGRFMRTGPKRGVVFDGKTFELKENEDFALICACRLKQRTLILVSGMGGPGTFAGCQLLGKDGVAQIANGLTWVGLWRVPFRVSPGHAHGGDPRTLSTAKPPKLIHDLTLEHG